MNNYTITISAVNIVGAGPAASVIGKYQYTVQDCILLMFIKKSFQWIHQLLVLVGLHLYHQVSLQK